MSFNKLKKSRTNIADLASKLESQGKKSYDTDDRYWYPKRDENSNGYAVIRFLPPPGEEDASYIQTFRHGYKGPNGWFIENCPTTIEKDCPVCTANSQLYTDLGKEQASRTVSGPNGRKRKMSYISNVYIVSDPETPANEGKVFLFKYGAKIFEKIKLAVSPEFPDETPIDPFDLWEGANFKLKIRKVDGNVNYDTSTFDASSELGANDKERETIYNSEHSLAELITEDKYKSYEDLKKRFDRVSGNEVEEEDTFTTKAPEKKTRTVESSDSTSEKSEPTSEEDEDTIEFFKDLVEG